MGRAGVVVFACALSVILAPAARGATVTANDASGVVFTAAPGERNVVTVDREGPLGSIGVVVRDTGGALLIPGVGCVFAGLDTSICIDGEEKARHHVELGDGDDSASVVLFRASIDGGPGDDVLTSGRGIRDSVRGGPGDDVLTDLGGRQDALYYDERTGDLDLDLVAGSGGEAGESDTVTGFEQVYAGSGDDSIVAGAGVGIAGGAGDDELAVESGALEGGAGDDELHGGTGTTYLDGGPGADLLDGGGGDDSVTYFGRPSGVNVDLDGSANDGEAGEADNVQNIESVTSTTSADTIDLSGSPDAALIQGWEGDDVIVGSPGGETIMPGWGNDVVDAGGGDDAIFESQFGDDDIRGGAGFDTYRPPGGGNTVSLDDLANDGELSRPSRSANIHSDIEKLLGTHGDDIFVGNADPQTIVGVGGSDRIMGLGGDDRLYGDCEVAGCVSFGNDTLEGGDGDDLLDGGPRDDVLAGGAGVDEIRCGDGFDTNVPDPLDALVLDCEA